MTPGSLKTAAEAASMLAFTAAVRLKRQLPVSILCDFFKRGPLIADAFWSR